MAITGPVRAPYTVAGTGIYAFASRSWNRAALILSLMALYKPYVAIQFDASKKPVQARCGVPI
jgi:hypothetical protein